MAEDISQAPVTAENQFQVHGTDLSSLIIKNPVFTKPERWQATNIFGQASVARDAGNGMVYPEMTTVQLWIENYSGRQEWRELPIVQMGACLKPLDSPQQAWEVIPGSLTF
jgi:hypothetical protein